MLKGEIYRNSIKYFFHFLNLFFSLSPLCRKLNTRKEKNVVSSSKHVFGKLEIQMLLKLVEMTKMMTSGNKQLR